MNKKTNAQTAGAKDEIAELIEKIAQKRKAGELSALTVAQLAKLKPLMELNDKDQKEREHFRKRGYRYGTLNESWEALRSISEATRHGKFPPVDAMHWLAAAVQRTVEDDPKQLIRELGLYVMGRRRLVDPDEIAARVEELKNSGSSIMDASEIAAREFGCATKTAYRWHRDLIMGVKSK